MRIVCFALLSLFLLFAGMASGQKKIAIIESSSVTSPVVKNFQDTLYRRLASISGITHTVYFHEGDTLRFDPSRSSTLTEVQPDLLMYVSINLFENAEPALQMVRPEGKPPTAHFYLSKKAEVRCKFIDVATNTVVHTSVTTTDDAIPVITDLDMTEREGYIAANNYKNYFSLDPDYMKVNRSREYASALSRMHRDYEARFRGFHMNKRNDVISMIVGAEMNALFPEPMRCTDAVIENEKTKKVFVELPVRMVMPEHVYMEVFALDTVREYVIPDRFGLFYVDDHDGQKLRLDAGLGSKSKQAGEAWAAGRPLYASFSKEDISSKRNTNHEDLRLGIDFGHMSIERIEKELSRLKGVTILDLGMIRVVNLLRTRFGQPAFEEGAEAVAARQLQFVFYLEGKNVHLLEPVTNRTIATYDADLGLKGFMDEAMELFAREIEVIDITKEKNGKAQKIRLYSPLGFLGDHVLLIYTVSGTTPTEIGQCSELGAYHSIAEFNVNKGEDAVYKAITGGQTLRFRNRTFRFLGQSFK